MLWEKVHTFIEKHAMIKNGETVLIGLSGGADSVCLLRYLLEVRRVRGIELHAVHINHGLRGTEARRDEEFSRSLCRQWGVDFHCVEIDVAYEQKKRRCSMEEAGRLVRYECFHRLAEKFGCGKIAVAHHKNDVAETVLFRLARGTGVRGLAGIRPVNGTIIRPLLCLTREEIIDILSRLGQPYVEDSTNKETEYSRNYIRNCLLPDFCRLNARAAEHMAQTAQQAAELLEYLEPLFQKAYRETVKTQGGILYVETEKLLALPVIEQKEVLLRMFSEYRGGCRDISSSHLERVLALAEAGDGKKVMLPGKVTVLRETGRIYMMDEKSVEERLRVRTKAGFCITIDRRMLEAGRDMEIDTGNNAVIRLRLMRWDGGSVEKKDCVKYFDYDRIYNTLCLRTRQSGDYFIVNKDGRHKMLRRYFIDEKIPAARREEMPLLADGSHILWIIGKRISEGCKVTADTKRVLAVSLNSAECSAMPENSAI